jgi:type VI secretion system protein ImpK
MTGGVSPAVLAAARPLLDLAGRMRFVPEPPDLEALRQKCLEAMQNYERQISAAGVPQDQARVAHYALCATLDDVILSRRWGNYSIWARHGMVWSFHQDATSGDRFYDILAHLERDPITNRDLLRLMYLCLSTGFEGRLRIHPQRVFEHSRVRDEVYRLLRGNTPSELSPQWMGTAVARQAPPLTARLVAAIAGAALFCSIVLYAVLALRLGAHTQALDEAMAAAPPQPPASLATTVTDRMRRFLAPEIKADLLSVADATFGTMVRIHNRGVFASASADVDPRFVPLIDRVGQALAAEKVKVQVIGYTDNQPISTPQFPSNLELSRARAQAVAALIGQRFNRTLIQSEGRGDSDPIDTNGTDKGREANRRTEIHVIWR